MMASSVAVQGLGMLSALWVLSVGNRLSGVVGLDKVLAMRLPIKQRSYKYEDDCTAYFDICKTTRIMCFMPYRSSLRQD